jgi:hypothetical protein
MIRPCSITNSHLILDRRRRWGQLVHIYISESPCSHCTRGPLVGDGKVGEAGLERQQKAVKS